MTDNPLEILGVPKSLVVREHAKGSADTVLKLAENFYSSLVKLYHPDRPTGDADLMASFAQAIGDLRDPDTLEYFIEEMLDESTVARQQMRSLANEDAERDRRITTSLIEGLNYINQYEVLGVDKPVSLVLSIGADRLILEIKSPTEGELYSSFVPEGVGLAGNYNQTRLSYEDGRWHETYLVDYDEHVFVHDQLTHLGQFRLVGYVDPEFVRESAARAPNRTFSEFSLEQFTARPLIDPVEPRLAWFLPGLQFDRVDSASYVLRSASGGLLDAGLFAAMAPLG